MKHLGWQHKEIEKPNIDLVCFDYVSSADKAEFKLKEIPKDEKCPELGFNSIPKKVELKIREDASRIKIQLKKEISEIFNKIPSMEQNIGIISKDEIDKLYKRISISSYYIANEGRLGPATSLITNPLTFEKYLKKLDLSELKLEIIINEFISDEEIYLYRNNDIEQPGYYILSHTDKDNLLYASVVSLGLFPEKQIFKIEIK